MHLCCSSKMLYSDTHLTHSNIPFSFSPFGFPIPSVEYTLQTLINNNEHWLSWASIKRDKHYLHFCLDKFPDSPLIATHWLCLDLIRSHCLTLSKLWLCRLSPIPHSLSTQSYLIVQLTWFWVNLFVQSLIFCDPGIHSNGNGEHLFASLHGNDPQEIGSTNVLIKKTEHSQYIQHMEDKQHQCQSTYRHICNGHYHSIDNWMRAQLLISFNGLLCAVYTHLTHYCFVLN